MIREVSIEEISDGRLYSANDMVKADCADCKGCSACCKGMGNSIVLDPMDIFRLETGLKMGFEGLINAGYVELTVIDGLILPCIKMSGEDEKCSFLNSEGRCSIHPYRPGICRLFPLGRYYEENGFKYFLQTGECKNNNRTKVKVKKWIDTPELKKYEQFILDWHFILKNMRAGLEENDDIEFSKRISMTLLELFYLKAYNLENDFYEQFYERKEILS